MFAAYIVFAAAVTIAGLYLGLVHLWLGKETTASTPTKPATVPARPERAHQGNLRPAHA
jgi:hypothetical protein